ncbi:MAG: hypothetical protein ACD_20C00183G0011 [uncultured bacterium]|nr:MAG: hypothetical protein ACD_20C00183G0011 [uncultured bacterium]HBH19287.1 hypothetical protein [Cyanobacteria bacterium UBA9579]
MKIRRKTVGKILLLSLLYNVGLYVLFSSTIFSNKTDIKALEDNFFGGVVINETNHKIKVVDNGKTIIIPPRKSSRDVGVFDVDYFVIQVPTRYRDKVYYNGVVKFNDFSSLKLSRQEKVDKASVTLDFFGTKK